tara:strand:- start:1151 stop:1633 length:483 start_codon:yes stop_codon:yes gene_type:complete
MFRAIAFIKFLIASTNQHGVHSPFMYNYVTKCLYKKDRLSEHKSKNVLLKSIAYFNVSSVFINDPDLKKMIQTKYPHLNYNKEFVDFVYLSEPIVNQVDAIKNHNNTVIFIDNIHKTKQTEMLWKKIKNLDTITVTVDLFYCAIVFFRKEQAKEHFNIRI